MTRQEKTDNWLKSIKLTKEKRKHQTCKVFTLKFDKDKLSSVRLDYLNSLFTEAKWVYNHILSLPDVFKFDSKITEVNTLDKDKKIVVKKLIHIGSQMKQAIHRRICSSIKTLSVLKKSGKQVGGLKFRSRLNSITLDQFKVTYKFEGNFLKLQGNRKMKFKLLGLEQIPKEAEITNATLVRRSRDFYLKVACFVKKEVRVFPNKSVGIDAGCSTALTLSDGTKYDVCFPVSKRTKRLQKGLKNKKKRSNNYWKHLTRLEKSTQDTCNRKKDRINKVVSEIVNKYETVCIQKESVKGWKSQHGKAVQFSSIGGIMMDLKKKSNTSVEVSRFFASTQLCSCCGHKQKVGIWERIYYCTNCGSVIDRDTNSAVNIEDEGLKSLIKKVPTGCRDLKPVELETSVASRNTSYKFPTMKQEAVVFEGPLGNSNSLKDRVEALDFRQG